MAQSSTYRLLPEGPVLCDTCSRSGASIEMAQDPTLPPEAQRWADDQDTELQSYRCPECERVEVFRVE